MLGNVKDKVVIITGSASGIGKGMAEAFAKNGAKVVIADLSLETAENTAKELNSTYNASTLAVKMDVSDEDEVNRAVDTVVAHYGQLDILINNAGIQIISSIMDFEFTKWKKVVDVHLHGSFLTAKACMNKMRELKTKGRIIIVGSVHSLEASKNKAAYVAAKHAVAGLVKSIAKEGAEFGISSNLICPGFVLTPLVEKQIPEQALTLGISEDDVVKKIMLGNTVDGEFSTIDDIANVALFLAGFETNALTGQKIVVSHGWGM